MTTMSDMTSNRFQEALDLLGWSPREFSEWIDCDVRMVRNWASGRMLIPVLVADWVEKLASHLEQRPKLRSKKDLQ